MLNTENVRGDDHVRLYMITLKCQGAKHLRDQDQKVNVDLAKEDENSANRGKDVERERVVVLAEDPTQAHEVGAVVEEVAEDVICLLQK